MNLQLLLRFCLFPCFPLKPSQNTQTFCANNIRFDIKYAKQLMISKPGYSWFYKVCQIMDSLFPNVIIVKYFSRAFDSKLYLHFSVQLISRNIQLLIFVKVISRFYFSILKCVRTAILLVVRHRNTLKEKVIKKY